MCIIKSILSNILYATYGVFLVYLFPFRWSWKYLYFILLWSSSYPKHESLAIAQGLIMKQSYTFYVLQCSYGRDLSDLLQTGWFSRGRNPMDAYEKWLQLVTDSSKLSFKSAPL